MKRYVADFADDMIDMLSSNRLMKEEVKEQIFEKIRAVLYHCERGNITAREAVKAIANATEE